MGAAELMEFLAEGMVDMESTAGVSMTLTRAGVSGSAALVGVFTPGAATYSVEADGNIFTVAATALVPRAAVSATVFVEPRIGDVLGVLGDARFYKIVGVRGSTVDPAWHLDLSLTSGR